MICTQQSYEIKLQLYQIVLPIPVRLKLLRLALEIVTNENVIYTVT